MPIPPNRNIGDAGHVNDHNDIAAQLLASPPIGCVTAYAGSSAPTGYLLCQGQNVSRTTYADLFAVIGTTYGSGDGSTTFTIPNLKGRVPVGLDSGQAEFDALNETGGAKTHTLTAAESGVPAHGHGSTGGMSANESHTHSNATTSHPTTGGTGWDGSLFGFGRNSDTASRAVTISSTNLAHTHTVNNNTAAGASQAHNNLQPYVVLNYIIRAS